MYLRRSSSITTRPVCRLSASVSASIAFTCVQHLLDDHRHLALQHGVEQLDDEDEAGAEDQQRRQQKDEAHGQVWQRGVGENVGACGGRAHDHRLGRNKPSKKRG